LEDIVRSLSAERTLQVATLTDAASQTGGLKLLNSFSRATLKDGLVLDLGKDSSGQPLRLEAHSAGSAFTLLSVGDRILFASDAAAIQTAPCSWRKATQGRYDLVYLSTSDKWFTSPEESIDK
jgi:hypothetical protein